MSTKGESATETKTPHLCRVPTVFRTWYAPGGRQNGGLQASPPRRGVRTTLVSGSQSLNEVETSPRHHVQRRASPVYPRPRRRVKLLFGDHRVQELPQCAEAGGDVLVVHVLLLALLAEAKELVGHVQGG